jgi:hypothetical protein
MEYHLRTAMIKNVRTDSANRMSLLFEHARTALSGTRLWITLAAGLGLGLLFGLPLGLLVIFHDGPWTGFLWDLLWRLPFAFLCLFLIIQFTKAFRAKELKGAGTGLILVVLFFCSLTGFAWYSFAWHVSSVIHFHRLAPDEVRAVRVGCHVTEDWHSVKQIAMDLRGAEWYSPDSHGWAPYALVILEFADGHREEYSLTRVLAENRLVIRVPRGGRNLLAVPRLRKFHGGGWPAAGCFLPAF